MLNLSDNIKPLTQLDKKINNDKPKNILSIDNILTTKTYNSFKDKITQLQYYQRNGAADGIIKFVMLESKPFGTYMENIISELFNLGKRTSPQNDATFNNKKIKIKSARYWAGSTDCKWQHIEIGHDYDYVLFVLLDFLEIKVWSMEKSKLVNDMIKQKILTAQGKQGYWTNKSAILPYLTQIKTIEDLTNFIK